LSFINCSRIHQLVINVYTIFIFIQNDQEFIEAETYQEEFWTTIFDYRPMLLSSDTFTNKNPTENKNDI
jgi:hypothetical protein